MTVLRSSLLLAALVAQSPTPDSLPVLALTLPESALVSQARARPLAVREAVAEIFARLARTPRDTGQVLLAARRLADAYAIAWRDSFYVRQVAQFASWPRERRAAKLWADSVRRVGVAAYGRRGPTAAIAIWRRAAARAGAIGDTAGLAATLGNIGAGFVDEGRPDSAERYLERARTLAAEVGDRRVEANALGMLAGASELRGDLATSRRRYAEALALRGRVGDTRGMAADYNNLGLLAQGADDLEEASRQFEAALALNRREGRDEPAATNLVNLAGLASMAGDFARAEALYREALGTWRARELWADAASALHGLGQLELRRGDYPAARAALREALTILDRTGPLADALDVRRELAGALAASGDLQGALDELRRAQQLAAAGHAPAGPRAALQLARADLAMRLNALGEAERLYAGAELLFRQAGDPVGVAEAQEGQGMLSLERGDWARAQAQLEAALRTEAAAGNQRAAALTRVTLGRVARERGDTALARRQLARAAADLERLGDPVALAAALGERAALEASAALPAAADSLYRAALTRLADRLAPDVAWQLHAGLAAVLRGRGAVDAAAREYRAALAAIERTGRSLTLAERRAAFLADKWAVYAHLVLTERARGRPEAAFEASERLRAREMLELLARGRIAAPSDTSADLVAREQDLRRRIAELTQELEEAAGGSERLRGPDVSLAGGPTREALLRAQQVYADLLLEMRERAPRHSSLVVGVTASWQDVSRRLAADEAFVEYLVSDSAALAFVVTRDTIGVADLGIGRRELARLVEFARGTLGQEGAPSADSLWRGSLRRLHRYLIAPLEDGGLLTGKTRLVMVPHAELHYLPFAALLGGEGRGRFLIQRYDLTVTPSASVWLALGDRPPNRTSGTLAFAPRGEQLPASRQEVAAIAREAGPDVRVLTGGVASEAAFRRDAPSRRVLHLATYGVLNKQNPLFSYVDLAPGGGQDGRLEVHEVLGLSLAADLVVLSACQTGLASGQLADVPTGDDWVGLTRAFLHAGADRVVATLWPVDDRATAALMERFYQAYTAGADPARALAQAQRALLAAPATAHPFYWGGFVAVGGAR